MWTALEQRTATLFAMDELSAIVAPDRDSVEDFPRFVKRIQSQRGIERHGRLPGELQA